MAGSLMASVKKCGRVAYKRSTGVCLGGIGVALNQQAKKQTMNTQCINVIPFPLMGSNHIFYNVYVIYDKHYLRTLVDYRFV
jgi:hypothetical protein